ncbi:MAG: type I methionyl aminopeptidase, partial [Candidatus Electrothrix sp. AR4]|nr:type I methionyl aminopeptidase [Candidatus Electrothrix sp. AR4]
MRQANRIVAGVLEMLQDNMRPGLTTRQMDRWAEEYCRDHGAKAAFSGYRGFPGSLCVSINEQVVHGIPSKKVRVREGDLVSVDFGVIYHGFYGDSAVTIPVGKISAKNKRLIDVTQQALERGINQVQLGNRISDISRAIQEYAEMHDYSVVRQFVGHGIGTSLHEAPEVPNYVQEQQTPRIVEGMFKMGR